MWYSLSMTAAWDPAIHEQAGKERDELAKTMSSAQVTQAQAEAAAWQPTTGASTLPPATVMHVARMQGRTATARHGSTGD